MDVPSIVILNVISKKIQSIWMFCLVSCSNHFCQFYLVGQQVSCKKNLLSISRRDGLPGSALLLPFVHLRSLAYIFNPAFLAWLQYYRLRSTGPSAATPLHLKLYFIDSHEHYKALKMSTHQNCNNNTVDLLTKVHNYICDVSSKTPIFCTQTRNLFNTSAIQ